MTESEALHWHENLRLHLVAGYTGCCSDKRRNSRL